MTLRSLQEKFASVSVYLFVVWSNFLSYCLSVCLSYVFLKELQRLLARTWRWWDILQQPGYRCLTCFDVSAFRKPILKIYRYNKIYKKNANRWWNRHISITIR